MLVTYLNLMYLVFVLVEEPFETEVRILRLRPTILEDDRIRNFFTKAAPPSLQFQIDLMNRFYLMI